MIKQTATYGTVQLTYFSHGKKPILLFQSGIHGDEYEVIDSLEKSIEKYLLQLPSFTYVPKVSPSAVAQKTRHNKNGVDINRSFYDEAEDEEVKANIQLVSNYQFETCYSFHEDPEETHFYLYDTGVLTDSIKRSKLLTSIKNMRVELLTGLDDPRDPALGFEFREGYGYYSYIDHMRKHGMFAGWAISKGVVKNEVMFEIPGKVDKQVKDKLVDIIFETVIVL